MRDRFADRGEHVAAPRRVADVEPEAVKATPPKPPPAGLDPVRWATLSRGARRALLRHHRKVTGAR